MKVCLITRYPWSIFWGGAEVQAQYYLEKIYQYENNIEIEFIDYYDKNKKYDIYHFIGIDYSTSAIMKKVKANGGKIILSPIFYLNSKKERVAKLINNYLPLLQTNWKFYGAAMKSADIILPNSHAEMEQIINIWSLEENKFKIIPNGYDETIFNQVVNINKEQINLEKYVLCVSMIDERKNILQLMKSFNKIRNKVNFSLVLIGDIRSSDIKFKLEIETQISDSDGRIIFLGKIENKDVLSQWYTGALAHILPSVLETPGLSSLEAMACGTPIVVGDCLPVREYFGKYANYIDGNTETQIIEVLLDINNNKLIKPNAEYIEKFSWLEIGKKLSKVYYEIY